jgi:hypothetical protein
VKGADFFQTAAMAVSKKKKPLGGIVGEDMQTSAELSTGGVCSILARN